MTRERGGVEGGRGRRGEGEGKHPERSSEESAYRKCSASQYWVTSCGEGSPQPLRKPCSCHRDRPIMKISTVHAAKRQSLPSVVVLWLRSTSVVFKRRKRHQRSNQSETYWTSTWQGSLLFAQTFQSSKEKCALNTRNLRSITTHLHTWHGGKSPATLNEFSKLSLHGLGTVTL